MPRRTLISIALTVLVLAGCGGGAGTFSAGEFVEEINANGATLELGEELDSGRDDARIYAVGVIEPGVPATAGGGSLTVSADADAGLAEYERCERAATLLCFRAANIVLLLEDELSAEELIRIETAITALAG